MQQAPASTPPLRVKCTLLPPELGARPSYHEIRSRRIHKHFQALRLQLIATVAENRKLAAKLEEKKRVAAEDRLVPKEREEVEPRDRDAEVDDLVTTFAKNGME